MKEYSTNVEQIFFESLSTNLNFVNLAAFNSELFAKTAHVLYV